MNQSMIWWQGVVEDRYDPLKLGRCRVRILGHHTDNKEEGIYVDIISIKKKQSKMSI